MHKLITLKSFTVKAKKVKDKIWNKAVNPSNPLVPSIMFIPFDNEVIHIMKKKNFINSTSKRKLRKNNSTDGSGIFEKFNRIVALIMIEINRINGFTLWNISSDEEIIIKGKTETIIVFRWRFSSAVLLIMVKRKILIYTNKPPILGITPLWIFWTPPYSVDNSLNKSALFHPNIAMSVRMNCRKRIP